MIRKTELTKILKNNNELSRKLYISNIIIKEYKKDIINLKKEMEKIKKGKENYSCNFFKEIEEYNILYNKYMNNK